MLWLLSLIEKNDVFFVLVTFLDRALRIIIHLARNAEKGGGVLMSMTVPKLKHSFIFPVPVPVPDPDPVFLKMTSETVIRPIENSVIEYLTNLSQQGTTFKLSQTKSV